MLRLNTNSNETGRRRRSRLLPRETGRCRMRRYLQLVIAVGASSFSAADLNAQAPAGTPSISPGAGTLAATAAQLNELSTTAGGITITYTTGQPITITAADGNPLSIPVALALRFINKRGLAIAPASIVPGTRMQAIVDGDENSAVISRVMVDQD